MLRHPALLSAASPRAPSPTMAGQQGQFIPHLPSRVWASPGLGLREGRTWSTKHVQGSRWSGRGEGGGILRAHGEGGSHRKQELGRGLCGLPFQMGWSSGLDVSLRFVLNIQVGMSNE